MKSLAFWAAHADAVAAVQRRQGPDGECELCAVHEVFAKTETEYRCPQCETTLELAAAERRPVGSTNGDPTDAAEEIRLAPVVRCHACDAVVAFLPAAIFWNANHDVYYTGGTHYVPEGVAWRDAPAVRTLIEQWYTRRAAGEALDASHLALWLEREVEQMIAEALVKAGVRPA